MADTLASFAEELMPWSMSLLEEILGTSGPELVIATQQATDKDVQKYAEAILHMDLCPNRPCSSSEVWPLFNSRMSAFRSGELWAESPSLGGISPLNAADPRYAGKAMFSRGIARILLYCHGLVLEDPLAVASSICVSHLSEEDKREAARAMFSAATASCVDIAPLVNDGVIVPYWRPSGNQENINFLRTELKRRAMARAGAVKYSQEAFDVVEAMYIDGINPALQEVWRRIRSGDRAPDLALIEEALRQVGKHEVLVFIKLIESWNTDAALDNVAETVARALDDAAAMGGEVDFFAPAMLFTHFLLATSSSPRDIDAASVRELARTEVPGLNDLLWKDVVSMRRHEDSFVAWRQKLSVGLREAQIIRERGMPGDTFRCIQDSLTEGRLEIRKAQGGSSFLQRFAKTSISFVLGAMGGALAGAPGGFEGTSLGAIGAGISGALPSMLERKDRIPPWLRRHYVLFDKSHSTSETREL